MKRGRWPRVELHLDLSRLEKTSALWTSGTFLKLISLQSDIVVSIFYFLKFRSLEDHVRCL